MSDSVSWKTVDEIEVERLVNARLQCHWATQILSAVADVCISPKPDDSHTNLSWRADLEALVGQETPDGFHLALKIPYLTISFLDAFGKEFASLPLAGKSIEEALQWVAGAIERLTGRPMEREPILRDYEMPAHPVGNGASFDRSDPEALQELAHWFHNGFALLESVVDWEEDATHPRCWPHHFDIGALISMGKSYDFSQSIGLGLSPGDEVYPEPYWYVNPYPRPETPPEDELPSGGHWHKEGWFGAVLLGSQIWKEEENQDKLCRQFLDTAISIEKALY